MSAYQQTGITPEFRPYVIGGGSVTTGFGHEPSNSTDYEWYTPPYIFEALGVEFDLDPCHPEGDRLPWIPAKKVYTAADDGLAQRWEGLAFVNPPYGKETLRWLARCVEHGNAIALVFARTGSPWFQDYAGEASAICFVRKRIRFCDRSGQPRLNSEGKKSSPGADSALIAWGEQAAKVLMRCGLGLTIRI